MHSTRLKTILSGEKEFSAYFWNMAGSLINALSSVLLTMVVARIYGEGENSDIFSLAYTTALMISTLGLFEVRQFQTSDVMGEFEFSEYLSMRCITCFSMFICIVGFVLIKGYSLDKSLIMIILTAYMAIGAFEDVYQGLFQLKGRLDLAGKSLFIRILVSMVLFFGSIMLIKDLLVSCVMLCVGSLIVFVFYDLIVQKKLMGKLILPKFTKLSLKKLFISCLPLCICSFLAIYVLNAPKYAIDSLFSDTDGMQVIFSILIMPAAVINLLSIFALRPVMTPLANSFYAKDMKNFNKIIKRLVLWILLVIVVCVAVGYFIGTPVLSWIYNIDVNQYTLSLVIILLGGGVSALLSLLQYIITIMRKQYRLLAGYIAAGIFAYFFSNYMVGSYGILGGAISYLATYIFIALFFGCVLLYYRKTFKA